MRLRCACDNSPEKLQHLQGAHLITSTSEQSSPSFSSKAEKKTKRGMSGVVSFSYVMMIADLQNLGQLCMSCMLQSKNFNIQECKFCTKVLLCFCDNVSSVPEMTNKLTLFETNHSRYVPCITELKWQAQQPLCKLITAYMKTRSITRNDTIKNRIRIIIWCFGIA